METIIKKIIDCKIYDYTELNQIDEYSRTETLKKKYGGLLFEGTESELDDLLDRLYDISGIKIIGIYNYE